MKSSIHSYDLYGDRQQSGWTNSFQFEWIPVRSSPYNYDIRPHTRDAFIQILYLTQGEGDVFINDARYKVYSPALILIPSQNVHGFQFSTNIDGPVVTAAQKSLESMASVVMPELVSVLRKPAILQLEESSRHAEALMPLFLGIEREWRVHAVGQVAAGMSLVMALLVQVARLSNVLESPRMAHNSRKAQQIEKFRALVDEHFRQRRPMAYYASEMGLTAGHLTRLCREVLNVSSQDVVNARILHEAQRELVYSGDGIKQVANLVGFVDEAYFTRSFRKHMGLTPSEFRVRALQSMNGKTIWALFGFGVGFDGLINFLHVAEQLHEVVEGMRQITRREISQRRIVVRAYFGLCVFFPHLAPVLGHGHPFGSAIACVGP